MEKKNELSVLMREEIVPVISTEASMLVDARVLHGRLGVGRDYSNWIRERIREYGFSVNEDYFTSLPVSSVCSPDLVSKDGGSVCSPNLASKRGRGGHNRKEYYVTLDVAKELAMVERNEKGRRIRRYFISVEKQCSQWMGYILPRLHTEANLFGMLVGYDYLQLLAGAGLSVKSGSVNGRRRRNRGEFWRNVSGRWFVSERYGRTILMNALVRRLNSAQRQRSLEQTR